MAGEGGGGGQIKGAIHHLLLSELTPRHVVTLGREGGEEEGGYRRSRGASRVSEYEYVYETLGGRVATKVPCQH